MSTPLAQPLAAAITLFACLSCACARERAAAPPVLESAPPREPTATAPALANGAEEDCPSEEPPFWGYVSVHGVVNKKAPRGRQATLHLGILTGSGGSPDVLTLTMRDAAGLVLSEGSAHYASGPIWAPNDAVVGYHEPGSFAGSIRPDARAREVVLSDHGAVLGTLQLGAHTPIVNIYEPAPGASLGGADYVGWMATDEDGDGLEVIVEYRADCSRRWQLVARDSATGRVRLEIQVPPRHGRGRLRVSAHDGVHIGMSEVTGLRAKYP